MWRKRLAYATTRASEPPCATWQKQSKTALGEMHNGDPRQKSDANDDHDDRRADRSDQWHADVLRDSWRGRAAAAVAWLHGRGQQLASVCRRLEPGVSTHHSRPARSRALDQSVERVHLPAIGARRL